MVKRIFVIDDDPIVCESLALLLMDSGYEVETANSGREALPRIRHDQFDLVLADYLMPDMDGEKLANEIKCQVPWLPVILITGSFHYHKSPLIAHLLRKPFSLQQLQEAVHSVT